MSKDMIKFQIIFEFQMIIEFQVIIEFQIIIKFQIESSMLATDPATLWSHSSGRNFAISSKIIRFSSNLQRPRLRANCRGLTLSELFMLGATFCLSWVQNLSLFWRLCCESSLKSEPFNYEETCDYGKVSISKLGSLLIFRFS